MKTLIRLIAVFEDEQGVQSQFEADPSFALTLVTTIREAALDHNVARQALEYHMWRGAFRTRKAGSTNLVLASDITKFLESKKAGKDDGLST